MHPRSSGQGLFPRYGGGWMHQFGHVYALQQELLNPDAQNWFRAVELWHAAREEGVAMNVSHYNNILRQCVQPGAWQQAMQILRQQKRECIRPDVLGVSSALAACAEAKRRREVEQIFAEFSAKMMLDSVCYLALIRARAEAHDAAAALQAGRMQEAAGVPFLPYTYTHLLEAAAVADDAEYAVQLVRRMRTEEWLPDARSQKALQVLQERHGLSDDGVRWALEGAAALGGAETPRRLSYTATSCR